MGSERLYGALAEALRTTDASRATCLAVGWVLAREDPRFDQPRFQMAARPYGIDGGAGDSLRRDPVKHWGGAAHLSK
jgi:hypothetical protein